MTRRDDTRELEVLISTVLRVGVVTSLLLVLAGTIVTFARTPSLLSSPLRLGHEPGAAVHSLRAIIAGVADLDGPAIVMAGLLLLIATPVLRVAVSIFIFLRERDAAFVAITAVVLALLRLSFALGRAGG